MPSSVYVGASPVAGSSERTPLLASHLQQEEPVSIEDEDVLATQEIGEGGQEVPQFPYLGKTISRTEAEHLVKFQKNGLLEGVPTWQFRCVFGGILMGYFVSMRFILKKTANQSYTLMALMLIAEGCHVRFHLDGLLPSSYNFLLPCL